jgi:hypothetical protein
VLESGTNSIFIILEFCYTGISYAEIFPVRNNCGMLFMREKPKKLERNLLQCHFDFYEVLICHWKWHHTNNLQFNVLDLAPQRAI